ncbi:MAG: 4-hydroxy-tetrahydrodipicolinate reductase [Rhodospirillaceae bacterium]|jgi:4-hydroxy-tetrahydrodipicolinate reductase|nr:4-hydroxy-tetrahydrodipicolinate reductase [Rhodospirillaceae bacterium]
MVKIGIVGCTGRMGKMLISEILSDERLILSGAIEQTGNDFIGRDVGEIFGCKRSGIVIGNDAEVLFTSSDVVVDFTSPKTTITYATIAADMNTSYVVGTTGLTMNHETVLHQASSKVAIVRASNMSIGINLMFSLVEQMARLLDSKNYDAEIFEMHHRYKIDSPSGTALEFGKAISRGRNVKFDDVLEKNGSKLMRKVGDIGFASLRGGDVVGDHTVVFASDGERIEISHKASSRQIFTKGAIRASLWVVDKPPGLYSMNDVLGIA